MKKNILCFMIMMIAGLQSYAVGTVNKQVTGDGPMQSEFSKQLSGMTGAEILALTPGEYKKMTGKRMGLGNRVKLKLAQKLMKRSGGQAGEGITKGVYIVMAIFGLAWIAMGIFDDWNGNTWIIGLILALLFWLPGLIFALIKMGDYY